MKHINNNCAFLKHCWEDRETLSEPEWLSMISNLVRLDGGNALAHYYSKDYVDYNPQETEDKITHALNSGPRTCSYIKSHEFDCGSECLFKSPCANVKSNLNEVTEKTKEEKKSKGFHPQDVAERVLREFPFVIEGGDKNDAGVLYIWDKDTGLWNSNGLSKLKYIQSSRKDILPRWRRKTSPLREIIDAVKRLAPKHYKGLPEPDSNLIPLKNGIYDLESNEILKYTPEYFFTNKIEWNYDPQAIWDNLKNIIDSFMDNEVERQMLYELLAYCLYRGYPIQKFFFLLGAGSNGKSLFLAILSRILGQEKISGIHLEEMQKGGFAKSELRHKYANFASEISASDLRNSKNLKELTGEDIISADVKYGSRIQFKNYAKLFFDGNQLPITYDTTIGFFRRVILLGFQKHFEKDITVDNTVKKYDEGYDGLVTYLIMVLKDIINRGFKFVYDPDPDEVAELYERASKPLTSFLKEYCEINKATELDYIIKHEFAEKFNKYLVENKHGEMSKKKIGTLMKNEEIQEDRKGHNNKPAWVGIRWKK